MLVSGKATAEVEMVGGVPVVHSLEGGGSAADLLDVFNMAKRLGRKVYLSVALDNPRREQLMKVYARFGAKPVAVVMEVSNG